MTKTFLLEVGLEEMPADVIVDTEKQLVEKTEEYLSEQKLTFSKVTGYSTPRRFAVLVEDLAEKQPDETSIVRGPALKIAQDAEGNWTKAAVGFSKGQGGSLEDLVIKEEKGEPYVFIEKFVPGKTAYEILQDMDKVVKNIEFPKNMKWGDHPYHYIRPIHWIVALLDEEVVPFEVFNIKTGSMSNGHRFLGEAVKIPQPEQYEALLKEQVVIPDRSERKAMIASQIQKLSDLHQWIVPALDSPLLEEVTDLVEYPTAFYGSFDEGFLDLPEVILETSMIDHQRYFPVRAAKGEHPLLPFFVSVRNGNEEHIENVARGNEKVLSARLADGKFFYTEDKKQEISDFVEKLKYVDYHERLGTIYDKQVRATKIAEVVGEHFGLSQTEIDRLKEITAIFKFDLVTQIVDEFPTLQGTMGGIYAKERELPDDVADAISEQYLPLSQTDALPKTKLDKYTALIDKLDTLLQFFSIGLIPTGSNDPHALRRTAIGMVRLILDLEDQQIDLSTLIDEVAQVSDLPKDRSKTLNENLKRLKEFILDRLEQTMRSSYHLSHDVRQAVLNADHGNLNQMVEAGAVLEKQKKENNYKETVEAVTRVLNMTKSAGEKGAVREDLIESASEQALVDAVSKLANLFTQTVDAQERYQAIEKISPIVAEFFDHNMIMVENEEIKENRLTLLNNLAAVTRQFADFSQLIV